ncbi:hypothetical protein KFE25_000189 [Diacronema lutheri]|uniref:Uncharacterized protein n=2 Tax=Diacronema lutheri TaxID=2081491 RepID=A0A8J5X963_DIALT|nr:hypothetical protein KFE25_000189 [Diacronema lutheri]
MSAPPHGYAGAPPPGMHAPLPGKPLAPHMAGPGGPPPGFAPGGAHLGAGGYPVPHCGPPGTRPPNGAPGQPACGYGAPPQRNIGQGMQVPPPGTPLAPPTCAHPPQSGAQLHAGGARPPMPAGAMPPMAAGAMPPGARGPQPMGQPCSQAMPPPHAQPPQQPPRPGPPMQQPMHATQQPQTQPPQPGPPMQQPMHATQPPQLQPPQPGPPMQQPMHATPQPPRPGPPQPGPPQPGPPQPQQPQQPLRPGPPMQPPQQRQQPPQAARPGPPLQPQPQSQPPVAVQPPARPPQQLQPAGAPPYMGNGQGQQHVPPAEPPPPPPLNPAVRPRAPVQRRQYAEQEVVAQDEDAGTLASGGTGTGANAIAGIVPPSPLSPSGAAPKPVLARGQSSRSIDPSQIPRPAPLPESAALASGSVEVLASRELIGRVPPLACSAYTVHDDGNASPRFLRLAMNSLMNTHDHFLDPRMPVAAVLQPLAPLGPGEHPPPVVDFGEGGPPRCSRCRAYANPFWTFVDGGRRHVCNLCGASTDVSNDYFCNLGVDGMRRDIAERPELCRGVCEFAAPAAFQARPPRAPPLLFVVEATSYALRSGLFANACAIIGALASELPNAAEVGVLTFDDALHFHSLPLEPDAPVAPKLLVCPDVDEPCVPLPCARLVRPLGAVRAALQELLSALPSLLSHAPRVESALGAALTAAHELLAPTGGRIICLSALLPTRGALKLRDRSRALTSASDGSSREKELLTPAPEWEAFARKLVASQVSVHTCHFAGGPKHQYADVASVSHLARATGGATYVYAECHPDARPDAWAVRLHSELRALLLRDAGWEGVLRVRCSKGLRTAGYTSGLQKAGDIDFDLPSIDAESAITVHFEHEDKLDSNSVAYLQAALLYTTDRGERRLRVINSAITTTTHISNVFRYADLEAILNVVLRTAMVETASKRTHQIREQIVDKCVDMLAVYRRHCASSSASGQLILPESLKLLPLFGLSLTKVTALRQGADITVDERAARIAQACRLSVSAALNFIYPTLYALPLDGELPSLPPPTVALSSEKLEPSGVFLLDSGLQMILWFGSRVEPAVAQQLVGAPVLRGLDTSQLELRPPEFSPLARTAHAVISSLGSQRGGHYPRVQISSADDARDLRFLAMLTEDRSQAAMSYVEFLCHVHRQIQAKLT